MIKINFFKRLSNETTSVTTRFKVLQTIYSIIKASGNNLDE